MGFYGQATESNLTSPSAITKLRCNHMERATTGFYQSCLSVWQSDIQAWVWPLPIEQWLSDYIRLDRTFGGKEILVCSCL